MEQHILTIVASVVGSVVVAFATMRAVIRDLRRQNASQQKQIDEVRAKADKCEEERLEHRRNLYQMLETCPITSNPCPLRAFFKIAGHK